MTNKNYCSQDDFIKTWTKACEARVRPADARALGLIRAELYRDNPDVAFRVFNAGSNTIPAGLQRQAILQEVITDFARRLLPLKAFATVFEGVTLAGTSKVEVPYYDLDATASTSWVPATGYAAGDTVTTVREIQVGSNGGNGALLCDRKYQGLSFTSEEISRQPFLNSVALAKQKADKLASDIVTHVLSIITAANYGAAAITKQAALFNSDDVAALKAVCKLWPEQGRSLTIDSAYDAALLKDASIKGALNYGSQAAIRDGTIQKLFGFDYREIPTLPANGENLVGFANHPSAILIAFSPVPPTQAVGRICEYTIVTDPATGISFEYRSFGDNTLDVEKHFIECSYGFAKGNAGALKRIVSA